MAPTPESAAFLAKKPTVPASFDGVDYDDTPRLKQAQDAILREQWVRSMMARLVREEMGKCYYREGVNHLEKCGALRGEDARNPPPLSLLFCCCDSKWLFVLGTETNWTLQRDISSCSKSPRSAVTCSSSKTTSPRNRWRRRHIEYGNAGSYGLPMRQSQWQRRGMIQRMVGGVVRAGILGP